MPDRLDGSIAILGSGLAGGNAAVALREEGFRGRVVLVGGEPTPPFGRPPLSKTYLRGEEGLGGWYVKPQAWYEANGVERITDAGRAHVDAGAKLLLLGDGRRILYDRIALCTGGRPRTPAIPGTELSGVHVLRTVADCESIKRGARPGRRAVVLGMGFIGAEVSASLRQLGVSVTAVFNGEGPLQAVLGPEVATVMAGVHRERGVELLGGDTIVAFEGDERVERVVTRNGVRIECDLVVIGAGIEPDADATAGSAVAIDNGILVDATCRTNVDGVFAAGDVANHLHPLFGRVRVEHYNNAEKMGRAVGRAMLGDESPYDYVHTFWSDQYDHTIEYVGHATRWDAFVVRGSLEERRFLGFYIEDGILRAVVGLNRGGDPELEADSELRACQELVARHAELAAHVLADDRVDLRELAA